MKQDQILNKLLKLASKRQVILTKLSQELAGETDQIQNFIRKNTTLWLANNAINAKYQFSFEEKADPGFDYTLDMKFTPAGTEVAPDIAYLNVPAKYKEYIVGQLAKFPLLQNKSIKVDVNMVPTF